MPKAESLAGPQFDCDVNPADDDVRIVVEDAVWCHDYECGVLAFKPTDKTENDIEDDMRHGYARVEGIIYQEVWTNKRKELDEFARMRKMKPVSWCDGMTVRDLSKMVDSMGYGSHRLTRDILGRPCVAVEGATGRFDLHFGNFSDDGRRFVAVDWKHLLEGWSQPCESADELDASVRRAAKQSGIEIQDEMIQGSFF